MRRVRLSLWSVEDARSPRYLDSTVERQEILPGVDESSAMIGAETLADEPFAVLVVGPTVFGLLLISSVL